MKRALKWASIILGGLIGIIVIAIIILHLVGQSRLNNAPQVETRPVQVPNDATALARGEHLVHVVSECVGCHGPNLAGNVIIDEAPIGYIVAPNLTSGRGGIGGTYSDADWERAIRHGIGGDGRVLGVMPTNYYANLSDEDLGAIIAYVKSQPPVDNELGARNIIFPGTILFGVLAYGDLPVTNTDHANVGMTRPPEGATVEYGEYLVHIAACGECHGANLSGRLPEEAQNGPPAGPNLTPGGNLQTWTQQDFITTMRTGQTPGGHQLSDEMPWRYYAHMTDEELQAIWLYLQSRPARQTGQ